MSVKSFNNVISKGGPRFPVEKNRYNLYVSFTCPFAQRAAIVRQLKGLEEYLPLVHTHYSLDSKGWRFPTKEELSSVPEGDITLGTVEPNYGLERISELYFKANPDYEGRWTVPALWDKKEETLVNNESGEMVRFFNTEFNDFLPEDYKHVDVYPKELQLQVELFNEQFGDAVGKAFFKTSFSQNKDDFEAGYKALLEELKKVDKYLEERQEKGLFFAIASQLTEADIKLFTSVVRLGRAYYNDYEAQRFSLAKDYPNLHKWFLNLYKIPAFKDTTDFVQLTKSAESRSGKTVSEKFESVLDLA